MYQIPVGTKNYGVDLQQHTVVITGVEEKVDMNTGELKNMLRVTSWGEEYYVCYEEAVDYKESVLSDQPERVHEIYKQQGLGGMSQVLY